MSKQTRDRRRGGKLDYDYRMLKLLQVGGHSWDIRVPFTCTCPARPTTTPDIIQLNFICTATVAFKPVQRGFTETLRLDPCLSSNNWTSCVYCCAIDVAVLYFNMHSRGYSWCQCVKAEIRAAVSEELRLRSTRSGADKVKRPSQCFSVWRSVSCLFSWASLICHCVSSGLSVFFA